MMTLDKLNLVKVMENSELGEEWIAYLASLKRITKDNISNDGEFDEYVNMCMLTRILADEEVVEISDTKRLKELLNQGYEVIRTRKENELVLAKERDITLDEVVDNIRQHIRPYRTIYLEATRQDPEFVKAVLKRAGVL